MHPTRTVLMSFAATASFVMAGVAEPQVIEYSRSGIDYVATIYTNANETEVFTVPDGVESIDYLVVGGGGGGGSSVCTGKGDPKHGGGGGAGGLDEGNATVTAGTILAVTVGEGGVGGTDGAAAETQAQNGGTSSLGIKDGDVIASASGGGAGGDFYCNGREGACGGGGGRYGKGAAGTCGGAGNDGAATNAGGGGGMGGSALKDPIYQGGPGVVRSIAGTDVTYAAGGCGAGNGHQKNYPGADGTGNGGDGGRGGECGNKGGSGVVVIRYAKPGSKKLNGWVREPSLGETVLVVGEGTTIDRGEAKSGTEVRASYSEEDLKNLQKGGYQITFTVDESDEWSSLEKTIDFCVRSMKFPTPGDPDKVATIYEWNGGEGYWCDLSNWSANVTPCFGYPNSAEFASAVVSSEATIKADPDGDMFGPAEVKDLTLSAPVTLTGGVFNVAGTLKATDEVRIVDSTLSVQDGVMALTGNAVFSNSSLIGADYLYANGHGKTFVEEGEASTNTFYRVRIGYAYDKVVSTNVRYVVKNGAGFQPLGITVGSESKDHPSDICFVIDNTAIDFNNRAEISIAAGTEDSFVELKGADAKLILSKGSLTLGTEDGADQTSGLCFRMPAQPYASAPVLKKDGTGTGQLALYGNTVIKLDVTDVLHKGKFPLVEDARGAFGVGIAAAGGDAEAYLNRLQSNLKVVALREDGSEKVCKGRVTLSIEDGVLYASVKSSSGLALIVR